MAKTKYSLTLNDFYWSYVARMRSKKKNPVPFKIFSAIITEMASVYLKEFVEKGIVKFPLNNGELYSSATNSIKKKTRWTGPENAFNDHSNGLRFFICWNSNEMKKKKLIMWKIKKSERLRKEFSKRIFQGKIYHDFKTIL